MLYSSLLGAIVVFLAFILGAPLWAAGEHCLFAGLFTTLALVDKARHVLSNSPDNAASLSPILDYIVERPRRVNTHVTLYACACCAIGASFFIPLDWERKWQVWPTVNLIGTVVGYVIGQTIVVIGNSLR